MNEALAGIVKNNIFIRYCIDKEELDKHTFYVPFSKMDTIQWSILDSLHILRSDGFPFHIDLEVGCYVSYDCSWAMILGAAPELPADTVARCSKYLGSLNIMSNDTVPIDVSRLRNLKKLRMQQALRANPGEVLGIHHLKKLHALELTSVICGEMLDVSDMIELTELCINCTRIPEENRPMIRGVDQLLNLTKLTLWHTSWGANLDLSALARLTHLELNDGKTEQNKRDNITGLSTLRELEMLSLCCNYLGESFAVPPLPKLKKLYLQSKELRQLTGLLQLKNLEELDFSWSGIRVLPQEIRSLKNLKRLGLEQLHLEELPEWLPELGLRFSTDFSSEGIILRGTEIDGVDMDIFTRPQEVILQWFEERKHGTTVPLNEVKVVFLGDGEAGKTHTIARLLKDGQKPGKADFDGKATPGIVIQDKEYELDGTNIQVHFWDFGGQEILHSMHRMFLTERTLYVVIINARDDTQDDRTRYWLHNIKSFAGTAPVLLVLNKIDQNPNASIDEPSLREMYSGLKKVVRLSALEDSQERFNRTFTAALLEQVRELGTIGTLWPASWLKLKTGLETMQTHYIHGDDYEDLCEKSGVAQNREELLHWFNDLGVSFCYGGSAKLEDYVILKPEWLTNAIYIILFNKCEDTENGIIPHAAINRMLSRPRKGQTPVRRVLENVYYNPLETDYVMDVIRKFRLSYKIREDAEFIPVLCQRESMPVAAEYAADPDTLEFRMSYEYLPDNVIHRLMVEMRQDLDTRNVWRTGARFVQQGTGLSAVVKSDGEVLRIFVRSENPLHKPNTYLHILKGNIDRINADMKLQEPYCEVIYKADGIEEAFDYADLIYALRDGDTTYRSKDRRRRVRNIPILDILNQTGRTAEEELNQLRRDIITACLQLQGNRMFWNASEDEWNTAIRDALRNKNYIVCDQTFQGISGGEKKAGELDLDIRKDPNIPWTIYEALKIKDKTKTKWNAHLKKLLDNYNPSGLNYLFLVTYVDCDKDAFPGIWEDFLEHIRWFNPGKYERMPSSFSYIPLPIHGDPNYIRVARCTYDRAGSPTTFCHIFARMGR